MKNKILRLIPLIALVLGLSACDDHNYGGEDVAEGSISFASFGVDVQEVRPLSSHARALMCQVIW